MHIPLSLNTLNYYDGLRLIYRIDRHFHTDTNEDSSRCHRVLLRLEENQPLQTMEEIVYTWRTWCSDGYRRLNKVKVWGCVTNFWVRHSRFQQETVIKVDKMCWRLHLLTCFWIRLKFFPYRVMHASKTETCITLYGKNFSRIQKHVSKWSLQHILSIFKII